MIDEYFNIILDIINNAAIINKSSIEKIKLDDFSGIIKEKLFFKTTLLEFLEVIKLKDNPNQKKKKYRYHFMTKDNTRIFRYDNAGHHHNIKTFPHHKHIKDDIVATEEPNLFIVLKEIKDHLKSQTKI